jgi:hypothetical protein
LRVAELLCFDDIEKVTCGANRQLKTSVLSVRR